jgi:hypothetical protein
MGDPMHFDEHTERDDQLLGELRDVIAELDPVPGHVVEAAEAALEWRTIDDELAELLHDSSADTALVGVRGEEEARVLSFAGASVRVEVEVSGRGSLRMLTGQLVPAGGARIEIRHADHVTTVAADERGRFTAADVPMGSISLRCHLDAPGHPRVLATPWLPI